MVWTRRWKRWGTTSTCSHRAGWAAMSAASDRGFSFSSVVWAVSSECVPTAMTTQSSAVGIQFDPVGKSWQQVQHGSRSTGGTSTPKHHFPMPYLPDVQCGTSFPSSALSGVHVRSPCGYCGIVVFPRRSRHWVAGSGRASVCNEGDANVYCLLACLLDLGHSTGPMRRGDRAGRRPRAGCLSDKTRARRPDWTLIVGCSGTSRHA